MRMGWGWGKSVVVGIMLAVLLAGSLSVPTANAANCDGWYGHACWRGYFKDQLQTSNGQDVIIGGMDVATGDKQGFINTVLVHLNSGDAHRTTAAQFIILSMSGAGYMPAKSVSQAQVDDWTLRVQNPAVTMVREDALFECGVANSFYQTNFDDIAAGFATGGEGCGVNNPMIDFYVNGSLVYRIRVACANPLGDPGGLPGLPPPVPPTAVSCGAIINPPSKVEPGDQISVTTYVTYSGGPPTPSWSNYSMSGSGGIGPIDVLNIWADGNTIYMGSNTFTVPANTGTYSISWQIQVNETPSGNCGGTFSVPGDSFDVFNYPYIDVQGGDTAAGARFATNVGTPCASSNTNAGISTWNKNDPSYAGAGGQYGASAFSFIQEFLTNKGNGNGEPYSSLSFGGVDAYEPAGKYGGFFGKGPCVDDWSKKPAAGQTLSKPNNQSLNGLDGVYVRTGDLTINPSNIGANTHLTIYVTGDVAIKGNIKYAGNANPTWASPTEIPSFKLVVQGRIFIDANVDQLDGVYVAVPTSGYETANNSMNDPLSGTISTCSSGFSVLNPANTANIGPCRRTLVVNGSFAANTVYFLRTIGSMSSGQPAEQFNYNPEVWLAPDGQGTIDPAYQSVVGLPPVL